MLIINDSFESGMSGHECHVYTNTAEGYYETERGEVNPPVGWNVWYYHAPGAVPHDPNNTLGYSEPETRTNAYRPLSGANCYMLFTYYRIHRGGLFKQFNVAVGQVITAKANAHAWSSNWNDPASSDGVGALAFYAKVGTPGLTDPQKNFTFKIGIDPTGGTNPFATTVIWGDAAHIYNQYHELSVTATATGATATVFLYEDVMWPLQHCDGYWDDVTVDATIQEPPTECPEPREPYERLNVLIPPTYGFEWIAALADIWNVRRFSINASADDAHYGPGLPKRTVLALNPDDWNGDLEAFGQEYYGTTADSILEYVPIIANTPEEFADKVAAYYDGGEPNPNPGEYDYPVLATGSKLHPHAVGEGGTYDMLQYLSDFGYTLPYVKLALANEGSLVQIDNLRALSPGTRFVVRLQEINGSREVEAPDFSGDPIAYMNMLLPYMLQYPDDIWELVNEPDPPTIAGHVQMANFMVGCMEIARQNGITLAVPAYSTGVPEKSEWEAIYTQTQFFQKLKEYGHMLSLHAYGTVNNPGDLTYHILRQQHELYENILIPNNLVVPYIFTEWNITNGPLPESQWLTELANIDALLAEQYYCLGISIFTFGSAQAWPSFDMTHLWRAVANLIYDTRARENALPPEGLPYPPEPPIPTAIAYSQRDPLWAAKLLLPSSATMGGSGCLVTAIAMRSSEYEPDITPGDLCDCLVANGGFNSSGGLLFYVVQDCLPWMQFRNYKLWDVSADMAVVEAALQRGSTIIKVDFNVSTEPVDSHFVYTYGWTDSAHSDLYIIDPWTRERTTLMTRYPRATLAQSIKGLVDYEIAPNEAGVLIGFNDHTDGAANWLISNR